MRKEIKDFGFKCSSCGNDVSFVIDSRANQIGVRRRRECSDCGIRFTTYEITQIEHEKINNHILELVRQLEAFQTVTQVAKEL